jgi:hypothetical protein
MLAVTAGVGATAALVLAFDKGSPKGAKPPQAEEPGSRQASELREAVSVEVTGPEEVVFDWSKSACEPGDIPDTPARAFRDAQERVQLIASHYVNRRMVGPDLNHLTHDCTVIMSSHYAPDPAKFNDHEWLHSTYTPDGTRIFALVHNEYEGDTHPGQCSSGGYLKCWYNAVTLAVSTNGGASFEHTRPPTHLVAAIPYRYVPDSGPAGIFNPSNIVRNATDGYYYALLRVEQRYKAQPQGICVFRTADLADPESWRAWDGSGFNVRFIDPYLGAGEDPASHVCQPVSYDEIQLMVESLTFNTYLDRYLLVGKAVGPGRKGETASGIYYSTSNDLVHWTPRRLIMEVESPHADKCQPPLDPVAYPSVLDPDSTSRNFETTDKRAYLYFTRSNYKSCRGFLNRDLVRMPIEFSK